MRRHLGRTLLLLLLFLGAGAVAVLRTDWAGEKVCAAARSRLPSVLGMEVALGHCAIDPLRNGVEITGFSITPARAPRPLFAADRLLVRLAALELVFGRIRLERIEAERPRVWADLSEVSLAGGGEGCFLDEMARVELDTLAVTGAEVHVKAPGGRTVDLDEVDLDLRMSRHSYAVRVAVPRGRVGTGRVELPLSRLRLSSSLDLDRKKLTVNHLEVAAGELKAFVRGDVETLCTPTLGLEASLYLPLDLVAAILGPEAPALSGIAAVNLKKAEGPLTDPSLEFEVTLSRGKAGPIEVGDAFLEARLEKRRVQVDKLELGVGEGSVRVAGVLDLVQPGMPFTAGVDLEDLPFGRLVDRLSLKHAWVDFLATGRVDVKGQLAPFSLTGPASVDVRDFHVYSAGWDTPDPFHVLDLEEAHADLVVDVNTERVRLGRGRVRTERGSDVEAEVTLNYDPHRGFHIDAVPRLVDLSDLGHIIGIPWDGAVEGRCAIKVIDGEPRVDGLATIRDFKFHALDLGTAEAQIRVRKSTLGFPSVTVVKGRSRFLADGEFDLGGDEPKVKAKARFEGAHLADLVDAIGDVHWVFDPLRGRADAKVSGTAEIAGPVLRGRSRVEAKLEDFTYLGRKFGDGQLTFRTEDGARVILDPIELEGPCGRLRLAGKVELDGDLDFVLDAPLLRPEELARPNGEFLEAKGSLAARLRFFGPTDHPRAQGSLEVRDLGAFGAGLGSGTLALDMDRTTFTARGPVGTDLLVDGRVVFEGDLPFAVGVSAATEDLAHYFPKVQGLKGALGGDVLATGTLSRYEESRGDVWLSRVSVGKGDWRFANDGPVNLAFQGGLVEIRSAVARGPAGARLSAAGVLVDGDLDVRVEGGFEARLLELFTPWVEQTGGRFRLSATVSGPVANPEVMGTALVEGGRFTVRGYAASAREVRGRLEFSQNKLVLADVEGQVNNGAVRHLSGDVDMEDFTPRSLDLAATLDKVAYPFLDGVPMQFTGSLRLAGPLDDLLLSGDVDLVSARYAQDIDLQGFVRDARQRRLEARNYEKREEFLRYDLAVHVLSGRSSIDNNLLNVKLGGDLQVVGSNVHVGMLGTLLAEEGGRGFYRGNEFRVTRAAITFTERDRIAPSVDASADGQIRDYRVTLSASGPFDNPTIQMQSEPSLDNTDILALLTLGVTSKDRGAYSGTAGAGLVADALVGLSGLGKQFQKFVPKNPVIRDLRVEISTQLSDASGIVEPTAQLETKVFTDSLKLRLSQPVITGRGRRAQAEYRFNDNMSAQVQWDNESSASSLGDLGLDLKLRWELE